MKEYVLAEKKIYYQKNTFKLDRTTLIFVHGISGSSSAWIPYQEKFKDSCNVLSFDLRGHGKSWKPKNYDDYTIKNFAEDLFFLVTYLKIDSFVLISHSFGALIALEFMTDHLKMIEKAIFLSPNFSPGKMLSAKIIRPLLGLSSLLRFVPFKQEPKKHIDYSRFINTGDWNIPRMIADIGNTSLRVYLYGTKQSYVVDYEELLDKINVPVLIVHGKKDTIFPLKQAVEMHKIIKNSQLIVIENSNHILVLNNFFEVSSGIEKFTGLVSA